jgi:hypothetical protein
MGIGDNVKGRNFGDIRRLHGLSMERCAEHQQYP